MQISCDNLTTVQNYLYIGICGCVFMCSCMLTKDSYSTAKQLLTTHVSHKDLYYFFHCMIIQNGEDLFISWKKKTNPN